MSSHDHGSHDTAPHAGLRSAVAHVAHHLPGQAPLSEFVHHNTLHGDQHLGFVAAVDAAMKRTGARGYPTPEACLEWYRAGRVTDADLLAAIQECSALDPFGVAARTGGRELRRDAVIRAILVMNAGAIDATRLRWELVAGKANLVFPADLPASAREALAARGDEAQVVDGVWDAVRELLHLTDLHPHPEHLADLQPGLAAALREHHEGVSVSVRSAMLDHAARRVERWQAAIGSGATHRELLTALTGVDIEVAIRPYLVRWMSAFLDEGVASWPLADRQRGLWQTWRELARSEPWDRWGFSDAAVLIEATPADPVEALAAGLLALGVDPDGPFVEAYLETLAVRLPGFFGMTAWREGRGDWVAQQRYPARLLEALAVRVTVERVHARRLCREVFSVDAHFGQLFDLLATRPMEVMVREALHAGRMPGHIAWRARAAEAGTLGADLDPFEEVALAWWTWNHTRDGNMPGRPTLARTAWPLFRVCLALGLHRAEVLALGSEGVWELQQLVDSLDEGQRGLVWLMAFERHYRDEVLSGIAANAGRGRWRTRDARPSVQIAFCIDDREEAIRRHLEEHAPDVETFGVAGFFGVPIRWRGLDDTAAVSLCPPALTAVHGVCERPRPEAVAVGERRAGGLGWMRRVNQALQGLRTNLFEQTLVAAVAGPLWAVPTLTRAAAPVLWERAAARVGVAVAPEVATMLDRTRTEPPPPSGERDGFTLDEQADRVLGTLRNVGLVSGFSTLVVWMGHGSHSRNNPHLAAYDCGACGGRHGGPNARAFAAMANDPAVRERLRLRGVDIPADCWFIGAEHDTADEQIQWLDEADVPAARAPDLARLKALLDHACRMSAHERCRKFESAPQAPTPLRALRHVVQRALDPFQARPELGHATNAAAVVGRRSLTRGLFLDRRAFLISYDPTIDPDTKICEGILAAVGPVGAGISLEYYFSTVDNDRFGCGTKVTHNIFGMIGVMEGTRGDLRTGLPKQMIEIHEPMRLLLIVEQTPEVLLAIVGRQPGVAELVAGAWIQVVSIDPVDGHAERFVPGVGFVRWDPPGSPLPRVDASPAWYAGKLDFVPPALVGGDHV